MRKLIGRFMLAHGERASVLTIIFAAGAMAWLYVLAPPDAMLGEACACYGVLFVLFCLTWLAPALYRRAEMSPDLAAWKCWALWAFTLGGMSVFTGLVLAVNYADLATRTA